MIDAKELRIGNKVLINNFSEEIHSINFDESYECYYVFYNRGCSNENFEYIKPIPITEEILLKCGFISNPYEDIYAFKDKDISFVIDVNKTRSELELHYKHIELKHLHKLQNIFFALTGKELEVNL